MIQPLVATALLARTHSGYAIAGFIAVCAVVSLVATAPLRDDTGWDLAPG